MTNSPQNIVAGRSKGGVPPAPTGLAVSLLSSRVRRVIRERFKILICCAVCCGGIGYGLSLMFTRYTWEAKASLLYTPLPVPESQKSAYTPPTIKSYLTMVKSEEILHTLCKEFDLPIPIKLIDTQCKVELGANTEIFQISFKWGEKDKCVAMTNRLMELFILHVTSIRRKRLSDNLADLAVDQLVADRRLAAANAALQDFKIKENIADPRNALERLNSEIAGLNVTLTTNQQTRTSYQAQLRKLDKHIADLKKEDVQDDTVKNDASAESLADSRRRQDRLRELIQDDQKHQEVVPALEAKQKQYERLQALLRRGAASVAEVERVRAEVGALSARINDSAKVKLWKEELVRIDQVVVPTTKQKKTVSPIIVQMLGRRLELDLQMAGLDEERTNTDKNLMQKRKQLGEIAGRQQRADVLLKEIEAAESQRQRIETQRTVVQQLQGPNTREFVVVAPAATGPFAAGSTKKLILGGAIAGGMVFCLGALVLHDLLRGPTPAGELVLRSGLPILSHLEPVTPNTSLADLTQGLGVEEVRGLTLRLRQCLTEPRITVLLTGTNVGPGFDLTAAQMASFLIRRDERVIIVDARLAPGQGRNVLLWPGADESEGREAPGLADYLTYGCNEPSEFVRLTPIPGVDYIGAGATHAPTDVLATHRMRELLEILEERYTLILVLGPRIAERVDLEILAAHADGILMFLQTGSGQIGALKAFLSSMREMKAPVLGSVVMGSL